MKGSTVRLSALHTLASRVGTSSGIDALRLQIETLGDSREVIVRVGVKHIVLQPAAQRTDTPMGGDGRHLARA